MKIGKSVRKSIDEWEAGDSEAAMLHACNAIDGTARRTFPNLGNKLRFTRLLRENYSILGPMGAPGINIAETRFPVAITGPTAAGGRPDLADVLYTVHRCSHGHGDELPDGFDLINDAAGPPEQTRMAIERGKVRLSDRVIFGMLSVAVVSPKNADQQIPEGYVLRYGANFEMQINEWWGRDVDFQAVIDRGPVLPQVLLDFGDWM